MNEWIEQHGIADQPIQYKRSFACRRTNHRRMERPVAARQERIDFQPGVRTVFGIDQAAPAIGGKELPV